jgi:cell division transport system ATP-binding protein
MIEMLHVSKRYPNGHLALDNVSFQLGAGEFAFLTGRSGAGKSTLLKLLAAIEAPTQGQIVVAKTHFKKLSARKIPYLRRQIGIILQSPNLLMDRPVLENVALPLILAGYDYREICSRVRAVLAKVSLSNKEKCFPFELSTGEQQRVSIARAVINKPALLLADEPTGNLDPKLACEIMQLFEQFNDLGMTILIASHDQSLINRFRHKQIILADGKLIYAKATETA